MKTAMHITTKVQPGHKVEIIVPELEEGETIDVVLTQGMTPRRRRSTLEIMEEVPLVQHSPQEWEQIEREFQEERNSWN